MSMKRPLAALAVACSLLSAGCVGSGAHYAQIAAGVAGVIGETKADPKVAAAADKLVQYCRQIQMAAVAVDIFASPKLQKATTEARIVFDTVCANPPRNLGQALVTVAAAYAAVEAARAAR